MHFTCDLVKYRIDMVAEMNWLQSSPAGLVNCLTRCLGELVSVSGAEDAHDAKDSSLDMIDLLSSGRWEGRLGLKSDDENYADTDPHEEETEIKDKAEQMCWVRGGLSNTFSAPPPPIPRHTSYIELWKKWYGEMTIPVTGVCDTLPNLLSGLNIGKAYSCDQNIAQAMKTLPSYEDYDAVAANERNRRRSLEINLRQKSTYPIAAGPMPGYGGDIIESTNLVPGLQHIVIGVRDELYANTTRLIRTSFRVCIHFYKICASGKQFIFRALFDGII